MTAVVVLTVVVLLAGTLGFGVWVGLALPLVGVLSLDLFRSMPADRLLALLTWNIAINPGLVVLPLFILMAEILFQTRISSSLFNGLAPWTNRLPGGLLHVNVLGATMFAAICGSSAATTATIGKITLSELSARGYDRDIAMGSLAGAGTLGFLIPPSGILIIYGVLSETSILKLFLAGVIPGLLVALFFMIFLGVRTVLKPSLAPASDDTVTWQQRLRGLVDLGPVVLLIIAVLGSMYLGFATPSEAAAVGVLGALLIAASQRALTLENLKRICLGTVRTTSMLGLITAGAIVLSVAMGYLGVPRAVAAIIAALDLSPGMLILLLFLFYAALGCILDGVSIIVMTLAIMLPVVTQAGFDKIWFGVFLVIVVEVAQITPPIGFNLFVIQGLTGEGVGRIAVAALPFFFILAVVAFLITVFPEIVMFLPENVILRG